VQDFENAMILLSFGANINALRQKNNLDTILHYSIIYNNSESVEFLYDNNANFSIQDSYGYTAYDRIRLHNNNIDKKIIKMIEK
jgi:ankyrin repeat protein